MKSLQALFQTESRVTPALLRLLLAAVVFPHGAQKLLGWWGGYGYSGTMGFFTQSMGIPAPLAFLVIVTEFFGPVALVLGLASRVAAFGIGTMIVVAAGMVHLQHGFFMNWTGAQKGEGFEYHILMAAVALAVMLQGAGRWSIDAWLARRTTNHPAQSVPLGTSAVAAS